MIKETTESKEVEVPVIISSEMARKRFPEAKVKTRKFLGIKFTVLFITVDKSEEGRYMKAYYGVLNDMLDEEYGRNRRLRCLIENDDGTFTHCPKKNRANHVDCAHCENRDKYKKDKKPVSLEDIDEDVNARGLESHANNEIAMRILFNELILELEKTNSEYAHIIKLLCKYKTNQEVFQALGVRSTKGYDLITEAKKICKDLLKNR